MKRFVTIPLFILLLGSCGIFRDYCEKVGTIDQPDFGETPIPPLPQVSTLQVPIYFTEKRLTDELNVLLSDLDENHHSTEGPVTVELKDETDIVIGTYTINQYDIGYGAKRTPGREASVSVASNKLHITIPVTAYAYAHTDLKHYESLTMVGHILNEVYKYAPELARDVNNALLDEMEEKVLPKIGSDLQPVFKNVIKAHRQLNENIYDFSSPAFDIIGASNTKLLEANVNFWSASENILEGNFKDAKKDLESLAKNFGEYGTYLAEKLHLEGNRLDEASEQILKDLGFGSDLAKGITLPLDATNELIKTSGKLIKETERVLEDAGKIVKDVTHNPVKAITKPVKKLFKKLGFIVEPDQGDVDYKQEMLYISYYVMDDAWSHLPSEIEAKLPDELKELSLTIGCGDQSEPFQMEIMLSFKLSTNEQFGIDITEPQVDYHWGDKCNLIELPLVGDEFEEMIGEQIREKLPELMQDLANDLNFKSEIEKVWYSLQKIEKIEDDSNQSTIYVRYNPESLYLDGVYSRGDSAYITANIAAKPELSYNQPLDDLEPKPINYIKPASSISPALDLMINTSVSYNDLLADVDYDDIKLEFKVKVPTKKKEVKIRYSKVKKIHLYGSGDKLVIGVCLKGFVKGQIYAYGVPKYDDSTGDLYFDDFDWSAETYNYFALFNIADVLFHDKLKEVLYEGLKYNVSQDIAPQIQSFNEEYVSNEIEEGVSISAELFSVIPSKIIPQKDHMKVYFQIQGDSKVVLH
jgi:hypothetical protein